MDGQLKIRNVYLSDLHFIRSIYNEANGNADALTEAFGLPLALVECQKQVIGYASVVFNSSNEPEIKQLFKKGFEQKEIGETMNKYAEKVLRSMLEDNGQNYSGIRRYIERFVDWLRWCV